jgi:predicted amidohydrolase YtcJ
MVENRTRMLAAIANLEREFVGKTITEASLTAAIQAISATQAILRTAHLKYHLATAELLTPTQVQRYAELRGYSSHRPMMHQHGIYQP